MFLESKDRPSKQALEEKGNAAERLRRNRHDFIRKTQLHE
jgi:hypothetical protein